MKKIFVLLTLILLNCGEYNNNEGVCPLPAGKYAYKMTLMEKQCPAFLIIQQNENGYLNFPADSEFLACGSHIKVNLAHDWLFACDRIVRFSVFSSPLGSISGEFSIEYLCEEGGWGAELIDDPRDICRDNYDFYSRRDSPLKK